MALETECPECHRLVGVVPSPDYGKTTRYKIPVHADRPQDRSGNQRRPRCRAVGYEVAPGAAWETTMTTGKRKARERQEQAAGRAGESPSVAS